MVTLFKELKKTHGLRHVRNKSASLRRRPLDNKGLISKYITHWNQHTQDQHVWPNARWYRGIGLHYNPSCAVMPYTKQLCGNDGRPDYQDTMAYDAETYPGLLEDFGPFPLVRSKITCLSGSDLGAQLGAQGAWHRDETPYEVLRVVIPLSSDLTYFFQIDDQQPEVLVPGYAYAFDQSKFHRVYSNNQSSLERLHLVLSFVTWFVRTDRVWQPGPFFNKVHPIELFDLVSL